MDRNRRNSSKNTRKYKKKFIWSERNERLLLKLWKERVHDMKSIARNKPIYEEIRQKLQQKGCFVELSEIKTKIHNISTKYRKEKARIEAGGEPVDWMVYDKLDEILSTYEKNKTMTNVGQISKCLDDNSRSHANYSEDTHYQYVNEDFFDNENGDEDDDDGAGAGAGADANDYDDEVQETTNANISMSDECKEPTSNNTTYLKAINKNLMLMVDKVNELSENIQSWEEKGNSQLQQISNILGKHKTRSSDVFTMPAKRIKLAQSDDDDDDFESISNFNKEILMDDEDGTKSSNMKSYTLQRNRILLEDYLKTKELERKFMTEKHNLQMEILKLELETKMNQLLCDA